jgi:radical SAM protein with 4Fe4S-binding SPASM domain
MKPVTDRLDLAALAPLERPLAAMFELTTRCNFACIFCPTAREDERKRVGFKRMDMDPELFKRAIDQFAEFPHSDRPYKAYYNGMGESMIYPQFIELVKYAVDKHIFASHIVRTNASMLEPNFNRKLIDAGMTEINIGIAAVNEEGYERLTRRKGMFDKILAGVTDLYEHRGNCRIYNKIIPLNTPYTNVDEFKRIFAPISDVIDVEYPMQWNNGMLYNTTLGQARPELTINGDPITPNVTCPYIFYTLMINVEGIVHLCCFDWSTQVNVGDMRKNTLQEIWGSEKIRDFWRMHLYGERYKNPACRDCQYIYGAPDYLDVDQRERILWRL